MFVEFLELNQGILVYMRSKYNNRNMCNSQTKYIWDNVDKTDIVWHIVYQKHSRYC